MLMGGGIDSTLVAELLRKKLSSDSLFGLHFDYGHKASKYEMDSVACHCESHGIEYSENRLSFPLGDDEAEVPARNAIFLLTGASIAMSMGFDAISIGIHSGTKYYDQSFNFIEHANAMIHGYFSSSISVYHPLLGLTKNEIIAFAQELELDLSMTYSCQIGCKPPCGQCSSCRDRGAL